MDTELIPLSRPSAQTNVLNFTPEFLGRVRLAGSLASLLGVGIFNTWLKVRGFVRERGLQGGVNCGTERQTICACATAVILSSCCLVGPQCTESRGKPCAC